MEKQNSNKKLLSMKITNYILVLLLSLIISCNQHSNQKGGISMTTIDEENIYKENENFLEAWNRGDANAAASFFTEDGVRVGAMGDIEHGREEIASAFENLMHKAMPGAKAMTEKGTIRILTPELAIWQGALEIQKPDGSPPIKGYVVQVMKKVNNKWMILETHPKLFPQPIQ
jgi:uncharacterized protein (TIGR02246 family)